MTLTLFLVPNSTLPLVLASNTVNSQEITILPLMWLCSTLRFHSGRSWAFAAAGYGRFVVFYIFLDDFLGQHRFCNQLILWCLRIKWFQSTRHYPLIFVLLTCSLGDDFLICRLHNWPWNGTVQWHATPRHISINSHILAFVCALLAKCVGQLNNTHIPACTGFNLFPRVLA